MKADIDPQRTPSGGTKPGGYDVQLTGYKKGGSRYLRLSTEELEAIFEAWSIERVKQEVLAL